MKLDLHTHCLWATDYHPPTAETVSRIVNQIKARGLDGIAITEHWDSSYGFKVKEIVEQVFNNEVLIIPGQEVDRAGRHEVDLYLPDGSVFRFLAHPGYPPNSYLIDNVHGIEIENSLHNWQINRDWVREMTEEYNLVPLRNSDAHSIERIGHLYNELTLDELCAHAEPGPGP